MNNLCQPCETTLIEQKCLRELSLGYGEAKLFNEGRCDCCGTLGPVLHRAELNPGVQWQPKPEAPVVDAPTLARAIDFNIGYDTVLSVTPLGVVLRGTKLTPDQYRSVLGGWLRMHDIWHTGAADLITYGRLHFSDSEVEDCLEQLEFPFNDATKAKCIAKVPWGSRHEDLTSEHYYVLGSFEMKPEVMKSWSDIAVAEKLTALELKRSIEAGKVVKSGSTSSGKSSGSGGIITIQAVRSDFLQWLRDSGALVLEGDAEIINAFLDEVAPIEEFISKARTALAQVTVEQPADLTACPP